MSQVKMDGVSALAAGLFGPSLATSQNDGQGEFATLLEQATGDAETINVAAEGQASTQSSSLIETRSSPRLIAENASQDAASGLIGLTTSSFSNIPQNATTPFEAIVQDTPSEELVQATYDKLLGAQLPLSGRGNTLTPNIPNTSPDAVPLSTVQDILAGKASLQPGAINEGLSRPQPSTPFEAPTSLSAEKAEPIVAPNQLQQGKAQNTQSVSKPAAKLQTSTPTSATTTGLATSELPDSLSATEPQLTSSTSIKALSVSNAPSSTAHQSSQAIVQHSIAPQIAQQQLASAPELTKAMRQPSNAPVEAEPEFVTIGNAAPSSTSTTNSTATPASTITAQAVAQPSNSTASQPSLQTPDLMSGENVIDVLSDDFVEMLDAVSLDNNSSESLGEATARASTNAPRLSSLVAQQAWAGVIQRFDGSSRQFEIRLDPAELGKIDVSLDISEDNKARIVMRASSTEALGELSRSVDALHRALADSGIDVAEDGISFELSADSDGSFTFSGDEEHNDADNASTTEQNASDEPDNDAPTTRSLTPELSIWSRPGLNLRV